MSLNEHYFAQLFAASDDPWQFRTRWYERRKRQLILSCLPRQHYGRVFEPACANGELSAALACSALLCQDGDPTAVSLARARLHDIPHAVVEQGRLPTDWPSELFDLIVLGEIGYYLSAGEWRQVIEQTLASLAPGGGVLACHWGCHPSKGAYRTDDRSMPCLNDTCPCIGSCTMRKHNSCWSSGARSLAPSTFKRPAHDRRHCPGT